MDTLALWNRLEPTDPRKTKVFKGKGGFGGTAINGTYVIKCLTEEFGPCGRGWKFVLENERIEDGHTLKSGDKARLHIVRGHLSYMQEGIWYDTSPQFGQTFLVSEFSSGTFTDEEAPKKSITDCIGKCAVLLGIGADIHLGLFDDNKYVNQRLREEIADDKGGDAAKPSPQPERPKREPETPLTEDAEREADRVSNALARGEDPLMQQRETEPVEDAQIAKAREFGNRCIGFLNTVRDSAKFKDWHKKNADLVAAIREYDAALHAKVIAKIRETDERFNPLGA